MIIMKFGGTSVANFEAITRTIFIIGGKLDQKPVVVVSALSKVTDLLYRISDAAAAGNETETKDLLSQLRQRHVDLAAELLSQRCSRMRLLLMSTLSVILSIRLRWQCARSVNSLTATRL